jgi:ribosome biogenesis protein Nip4
MAQSPIQLQRKLRSFREIKTCAMGQKQNSHRTAFGSIKKFISQLKAFAPETVDLNHVSERIQAAFSYFLKPMDDLVFEILWKIEEVKRIKGKDVYEELIVRRGTNQSRSA